MKALELKERYIKAKQRNKVAVVGHLSPVVQGGKDHFYHIHDDEEISHNVGVSFHIYGQHQDHWRDNVPIGDKE